MATRMILIIEEQKTHAELQPSRIFKQALIAPLE